MGLLVACTIAVVLIWWRLSFNERSSTLSAESGETWIQGRGHYRVLKLLDSGHYEMQVRCDVCDEPVSAGTWSRDGGVYVLHDASGTTTIELVSVTARGCVGLALKGRANVSIPGDIYFRDGDRCADAL